MLRDRIAQARRERGMTQQDLAVRLRVAVATVQRWEAGTTTPSLRRLEAIADATGRPVAYFVQEEAA